MAKRKRFEILAREAPAGGMFMSTTILVDTETGVLYLLATSGEAGGLTALLGPDGKPVIWQDTAHQEPWA